jgi:hypothetical protein
VESLQSASSRKTWAGAQRSRPAGVRAPRASSSWAMAAKVVLPARWISATTARVVAVALVVCSDLAARARAAVSTLPAVPSFRPPRLTAASAAGARSLIRRASFSASAARNVRGQPAREGPGHRPGIRRPHPAAIPGLAPNGGKEGPACKGWVLLCMQGLTVRRAHLGGRRRRAASGSLRRSGSGHLVINTRRVRVVLPMPHELLYVAGSRPCHGTSKCYDE